MEEGFTLVAFFVLAVIAIGWIALLLYGLHHLGKRFGSKHLFLRRPWLPTLLICGIALVAASLVLAVPADRLTRFCFGLIVFLAVAHPLLVGYWFARSREMRHNSAELWKRTDKWLAYWENRHDTRR